MKTIKLLILTAIIVASCTKPDEYYREFLTSSDRNYPGKLQNLETANGFYRLKIKYTLPPNNSANKIVVANQTDTLVFDIPVGKSGKPDSLYISNLQENSYRYDIYTLNTEGVESIKREATFKVYGNIYKASLSHLQIKSQGILAGTNDLRIIFNGDRANILAKTKFEYTQNDGATRKVEFLNPTDTIVLQDFKSGSSVFMSNGFLPNLVAFDTVYTDFKKILN